jgi:hypothetical protein
MTASRFLIGLVLTACLMALGWSARAQGIDFEKASREAMSAITVSVPDKQAPLQQEAAKRLNDRYVSHLEWQFDFAQRSWSWHFYSTILLFFIVLMIVAFGLYITYLQFKKDYKSKVVGKGASPSTDGGKPKGGTQESDQAAAGASTTMKLSAAGLELSSQIIGLFVLGFSLAFFYLYVKEVYPIQVLNLNQTQPQADASKTQSSQASAADAAKAKL